MSASSKPLVYIILGATGSGRRTVLADLVEGGLGAEARSVVLLSSEEPPHERDTHMGPVERWTPDGEGFNAGLDGYADATHVFFVTDGRRNPIDQIEGCKLWIDMMGAELGRVICVVNCRLAEQNRILIAWYEACIHFSDVVLLANREGVSNKWLTDFQNRFKAQFFPCLFEFVKEGRVKNPALLLDPHPRRVSHFFDEPDWVIIDEKGERDAEEEDDEEEETDEEVEVVQKEDLYMERRAGGRRAKEIADIAKFLQPAEN